MPRSWIAAITAAVVLPTLLAAQGALPATGATTTPVAAQVAAPVAAPIARAAIGDYTVATRWVWTQRDTGSTATTDQTISATISGLSSASRNGGFVLRRSSADRYLLVSFSGTRYQVRLRAGNRVDLVVNQPFRAGTAGAVRVQVSGNVVKSYWAGRLIAKHTLPALSNYPGTGTGVSVWQDRAAAVSLRAITLGAVTTPAPPTKAPPTTAPPTAAPPTTAPPGAGGAWRSGASGTGVADGRFAAWRGRPLDVAGTWNDNYTAQIEQWSLQPGAEYGAWRADLDVAVGGIYADRGETWAAAAGGAYDARWRATLARLNRFWGDKPGTLYIRFAHEFNGDWYPWSVRPSETADFAAAWRRFRALQLQEAPRHKLVFCPNVETSGIPGLDWRAAFPGRAHVDVMAVDAYNQYPFVSTAAGFTTAMNRLDSHGAPGGLEQHRRFAESVGLPFAVSEWSSNAAFGDSPVYVTQLHEWFGRHAGTGPGKLLYEVQFNVHHGDGRFSFLPGHRQPQAAAAYASLW